MGGDARNSGETVQVRSLELRGPFGGATKPLVLIADNRPLTPDVVTPFAKPCCTLCYTLNVDFSQCSRGLLPGYREKTFLRRGRSPMRSRSDALFSLQPSAFSLGPGEGDQRESS